MDELLQSLAIRPEPWTAGQIMLNTTMAFAMGLFVAWVYRSTHRQLTVSFSFVNTLVLLSMLMALVMMVIGVAGAVLPLLSRAVLGKVVPTAIALGTILAVTLALGPITRRRIERQSGYLEFMG